MEPNALAGPSTSADAGAASPRAAAAPTNRLYVGNLAPSVDEYALIQLFQRFGKLTKLDFMYHKTGALKGKPRGYAFVELSTKEDAQKAIIKLHDRLLRGRKLVVTPASSAPSLSDAPPISLAHKGRRSEPAKTTTLSLLKSKSKGKKQNSAAAQIAAMEAKLAMMQRKKPADEAWVPGQKFGAIPPAAGETLGTSSSREGTASPARAGSSYALLEDGGMDIEEELGLLEGARAADDLEREMAGILAGSAPGPESEDAGAGAGASAVARSTSVDSHGESARLARSASPSQARPGPLSLPTRPIASDAPTDAAPLDDKAREKAEEAARKNAETIQRGFATLPRKPAFL